MVSCFSQETRAAATLAKSLLELWLSGDQLRLRRELEHLTRMPRLPGRDDEADRIELLRSLAWRMKEASDLFAPRSESPRAGTWLDMLDHLSDSEAALS